MSALIRKRRNIRCCPPKDAFCLSVLLVRVCWCEFATSYCVFHGLCLLLSEMNLDSLFILMQTEKYFQSQGTCHLHCITTGTSRQASTCTPLLPTQKSCDLFLNVTEFEVSVLSEVCGLVQS